MLHVMSLYVHLLVLIVVCKLTKWDFAVYNVHHLSLIRTCVFGACHYVTLQVYLLQHVFSGCCLACAFFIFAILLVGTMLKHHGVSLR